MRTYIRSARGGRPVIVSTVRLPIPNADGCGWETMVFHAKATAEAIEDYTERDRDQYTTERKARRGHRLMVKKWHVEPDPEPSLERWQATFTYIDQHGTAVRVTLADEFPAGMDAHDVEDALDARSRDCLTSMFVQVTGVAERIAT